MRGPSGENRITIGDIFCMLVDFGEFVGTWIGRLDLLLTHAHASHRPARVPEPPARHRSAHLADRQPATSCGLRGPGPEPGRLGFATGAPSGRQPPVGIDPLVMRTGLSGRWAQAMRQDMGWKADWQTHDSLSLLRQLEDGQLPMAVFLGGAQADALDRSGLIHDRRTLAFTDVLLIGPQDDQAGLRGESDWRRAITQVLTARIAGAARWEPPPAGHALGPWVDRWSQGFTRQGALSRPAPPVSGPPGLAYSVTTRAAWQAPPTATAASG